MYRLANAMANSDPSIFAFQLASDHQACRIRDQNPILFVYDFCTCATPFQSLGFLHDAARSPLASDLGDKAFFKMYGLTRKLMFEKHLFKELQSNNCWKHVY